MKIPIVVATVLPLIAALFGPLIPALRAPELFLGFPRILVWTVFWGVVGATAAMLLLERIGGAVDDEEGEGE